MALIGVGIRLVLAPFTSYPNDDLPWYWMTTSGLQHLPVYARPGFSYPPIWGWMLELLGRVLGTFGATSGSLGVHDLSLNEANMATGGALATTITSPLLNVCIKGILTSADLLTALLVASVAPLVSDRRRAREIAFGLYFLNPLVINETAVRAGIDGLVALSIAATIALTARRRMFLAGVALALGVFVKLTPLALAPLVLAAVLPTGRQGIREAGKVVAGGVAVAVPVLVALLGTGQWAGFIENTFSRAQTGLLIGGPGFGGLRHFAALSNLLSLADRHSSLVLNTSLAIEAITVAAMTVWTWGNSRRSAARSLVLASTVTFTVIIATTPTSQPGYVLWLLPPLVLLASSNPRSFAPFAAVLSLAALAFSVTYYSPDQLLFPLAEYTNWFSPQHLGASIQHWFLRPTGLWGASYKEDYASVCAAMAILSYLFLVARCIDDRTLVPVTELADEKPIRLPRSFPERAVIGVAALSLVAMVATSATPAPAPGSTGSRLAGARFASGHLYLTGSSRQVVDESSLRVVWFPVQQAPTTRRIFVVVDSSMPLGSTTRQDVRGVFDNLKATLRLRGYRATVTTIDAGDLSHLLSSDPSPSGTTVVDTSGVLPTAVLSPHRDLLVPWLQRGGVLYWGGGPLGLWYADPGQTEPQVWVGGPITLLGPAAALKIALLRQAQHPTPAARALGLQYQDASFGPSATADASAGGTALGYVGSGASSVTSFPFERGRLVVFGGLMYANAEVAADISLIQMSGVLFASGSVATTTVRLGRWETALRTTMPGMERVLVFDPRPSGISFRAFPVAQAPK